MKNKDKLENIIRKDLDVRASDRTYDRMREIVLDAHGQSTRRLSAAGLTVARRLTMRKPMIRFAVAAAVIAAVVLGLFELVGTDSKSGVVWAEVARKVQASRGLIVRCAESLLCNGEPLLSFDPDYAIKYVCPTHSRTDNYKAGKITHTYYTDFSDSDTDTLTHVYHIYKRYRSRTSKKSKYEFLLEQHDDWMNPRYLIQTILSCEHRKLGQKTIEGVLCEGIETTDPASMGPLPEQLHLLEVQLRLWVDAKTEYPVLFESKKKMSAELDGKPIMMQSEGVMDQFQWDVELDASLFEPNIPPDYKEMK